MFEDEMLDRLKKNDHYHFSIPFEYIEKNYGNNEYDIAVAYMEVDVNWDYDEKGYKISFYCNEENDIDESEGNGDLESFYSSYVEDIILEELDSLGIYAEALCGGTGR